MAGMPPFNNKVTGIIPETSEPVKVGKENSTIAPCTVKVDEFW